MYSHPLPNYPQQTPFYVQPSPQTTYPTQQQVHAQTPQFNQISYQQEPSQITQRQAAQRRTAGYTFKTVNYQSQNRDNSKDFPESIAAPINTYQNSEMNDPENVNNHKTENGRFSNDFNHKAWEKREEPNEQRPFSSSNYKDYFSRYAKGQLFPPFPKNSQELDEYKKKVSELTKQVTRLSVEKSDLIVQVAQISRENHNLKEQMERLKEQLQFKNAEVIAAKAQKQQAQKGVYLDLELWQQIEAIRERQMEMVKIKKQFLLLLQGKYQEQMKKLADLTGVLKLQLHNAKFQLSLAKEANRQKQMRSQFMQKQIQALESSYSNQTKAIREKVQVQINEKNKEIDSLKYSLLSLERQYLAQKKQIADKDDFIKKVLAGQSGEDADAIQLLIDKYNFYSRQHFQAQNAPPQ